MDNFQLHEGALFDVDGIESKSRAELQKLAKEHGLKANARSVDIIDCLKAIHTSSSNSDGDDHHPTAIRSEVVSTYHCESMNSTAERNNIVQLHDNSRNDVTVTDAVDDRINRVLASQGLSWSDVLQLQHQFYEDPDETAPINGQPTSEVDTDLNITNEFYNNDDDDHDADAGDVKRYHHVQLDSGNGKVRSIPASSGPPVVGRSKVTMKSVIDKSSSSSRKRPSNDRTSHIDHASSTTTTTVPMVMPVHEQPLDKSMKSGEYRRC